MIRWLVVVISVLIILPSVTACGAKRHPVETAPTSAPVGTVTTDQLPPTSGADNPNKTNLGPYLELILKSAAQVEQQLGKPDRVEDNQESNTQTWVYDELGLKVDLWKGANVVSVFQTKGWITKELQIGDGEAKVSQVLRSNAQEVPTMGRIVRVDEDQFSLIIRIQDGRASWAQLFPPDMER